MALASGPSLVTQAAQGIPTPRAPTRIGWNPGGDAGIYRTLGVMRAAVNASYRSAPIAALVHMILGDEPDPVAQWSLLRAWLAMHTRFQDDPPGLELVRTPLEQLARIQRDGVMLGDCDDVATLAATLVKASGARARFVILGFFTPGPSAPYRHVYTEMQTALDVWRDFDVTRRPSSVAPTRKATVLV